MIPAFDRFVAVDWSGAKGPAYSGIAVAECRAGSRTPALVPPPNRAWRRTDFAEWLIGEGRGAERLLVGIDCAFALPAAMAATLLGPDYGIRDLWAYIDQTCADEDYYGGGFAMLPGHRAHFWHSGRRPEGFVEHRRACEIACRAAGLGTPESPLKLIGTRQVGKGGLAGMRVLLELGRRLGTDFAAWPFDPADRGRVVCVELYPRLFMRMARHGNAKVRTRGDLDRCLAALGAQPSEDSGLSLSDHDTDALVAAAGLRHIAGCPDVWHPSGVDSLARRAEGWIFGVS